MESNESEPLMRCRKFQEVVKIGVYPVLREECGRNLFTAQMATGIKAARTRSRLFCGTWEPVTPMRRERCKWEPHKYLSTKAGNRDGALRSSEESPVMGLERRGWVIASDLGQRVRPEEPFVQWKAAAFARWHEPDESRGSSPDL